MIRNTAEQGGTLIKATYRVRGDPRERINFWVICAESAAFELAFLVPALDDVVARTHQPHLAHLAAVVIVPSVRYLSWPGPSNARNV